ncbi:MAG TPA: SIS domain-containing protein, partial [Anaerolineaceae bacterium]|nr:SIS domain-containing protein [Anaerolineaceae bacterium]
MKANDARYGDQYIQQLVQEMNAIPTDTVAEIAAELREAQANGRRVFVFGNGGSAATAAHMACDFGKNTRQPGQKRLKVVSLSDGIATLTAYANDEG